LFIFGMGILGVLITLLLIYLRSSAECPGQVVGGRLPTSDDDLEDEYKGITGLLSTGEYRLFKMRRNPRRHTVDLQLESFIQLCNPENDVLMISTVKACVHTASDLSVTLTFVFLKVMGQHSSEEESYQKSFGPPSKKMLTMFFLFQDEDVKKEEIKMFKYFGLLFGQLTPMQQQAFLRARSELWFSMQGEDRHLDLLSGNRYVPGWFPYNVVTGEHNIYELILQSMHQNVSILVERAFMAQVVFEASTRWEISPSKPWTLGATSH